jgi:hypothetical protein
MAQPNIDAYWQNIRFGHEPNALRARFPTDFCATHNPHLAFTPPKGVYLPVAKTMVTANVSNFQRFFNNALVGTQIYYIALDNLNFDLSPLKDPVMRGLELTTIQFELLVVQLCGDKIPPPLQNLLNDIYQKTHDFVDEYQCGERGDPKKASTYYNMIWQQVLLNLTLRVLTTPGRSLDDITRCNLLDELCPPTMDQYEFRKYLPVGATSYEALQFFFRCIQAEPERFVKSLWRHRGAI